MHVFLFYSIFLPRTHFLPSSFFATRFPLFFIPRFVRKRERNRKSYYFSVDLCKRRREQRREQPLFYPFYVRFYVKSSIIHATMNLPNGITILALKRIIVDLLFQYILSITLWKRYSWIKAHEQRPDVDNRIGLMQVSSYKEYTCFTTMNVYTTIKSNFSFFLFEFSRTNGRLNGRLFPSSNIIKLYYITSCVLYIRILIREYLFTVYIYIKRGKIRNNWKWSLDYYYLTTRNMRCCDTCSMTFHYRHVIRSLVTTSKLVTRKRRSKFASRVM